MGFDTPYDVSNKVFKEDNPTISKREQPVEKVN
jgi:hypothetical protein